MLFSLFQSRDIRHRSKHHHDRDFLRSVSMFPQMGNDNNLNLRNAQFSRLLSGDIGMRQHADDFFPGNPIRKEDFLRTFQQLHMDSDDADDEDDERTPTVDRPMPKFP
jgi:hypothetical protein